MELALEIELQLELRLSLGLGVEGGTVNVVGVTGVGGECSVMSG